MPRNFQSLFLDAVLKNEMSPDLLNQIRPVGKLSPEEVIKVYQNDYLARMTEAIGKNYEATWLILGDEDFLSLAKQYVQQYPSSLLNLTTYGHQFPEFLAKSGVQEEEVLMAHFERIFWSYFHQPSRASRPLTPGDLETLSFHELPYELFHPPYKLYDLWLKREASGPEMSFDDFEGEDLFVVYKEFDRVQVKMLTAMEYEVLSVLKDKRSLPGVFSELEARELRLEKEEWATIFHILSFCKE